jgi:hypothetical protein
MSNSFTTKVETADKKAQVESSNDLAPQQVNE